MNGETLLIPGPVTMHEDVQAVLARPAGPHYGEPWVELHRGLTARLAELFRTEEDVLLVFGPGTAALEMGIRSTLSPGDHVLVPITGSFGARLAELAQAAGLVVHELAVPLGRPADPELMEDELGRTPEIRAVAIVQHETMLGLVNPLREVCALAGERQLLTIVDAVSSLGGIELEVDAWGIDICAAVGNKCLGGPVGIAPLAVSGRAWSASRDGRPKNAGWYLNLDTWRRFEQEWGTWHPHPTTMPSAVVEALDVAVRRILTEGPEAHRSRHAAAAGRVRQSLREMGFEMLVPDEVASPVTTAVRAKPEMSVEDYVEWLRRERRLRIAGATGELAGKVFRVAHMGRAAEPEVVDAYLASTREYLEEAGLC